MSAADRPAGKKTHGKKVSKSLIALSSAAVLGVYSAGYMRTRAAAERFLEEPVRQRPMAAVAAVGAAFPPAAEVLSPLPPTISTVTEKPAAAAPVAMAPAAEARVSAPESTSQPVETTTASPEPVSIPAPVPSPLAVLASAAPAALAAVQTLGGVPAGLAAPPPVMASKYKDGTYTGWGTCRHGDIQAQVVIADGKITSATVAQCLTRYSCSWIAPIVPQVVARQSPETDFVSGATDSTNAFYYAVVEALVAAKNK